MKRHLLLVILTSLLFPAVLSAQCKYEYHKKDALTDSISFRTEKFKLAGGSSLEGVYVIKSLRALFERSSQTGTLELVLSFKNKSKKAAMFFTLTDFLVLRFEDDQTITLKLTKAPTGWSNNITNTWYLPYKLTEEVKAKMKSGVKVKAMRIMSTNFNFDITEFKEPLTAKFMQCWDGN